MIGNTGENCMNMMRCNLIVESYREMDRKFQKRIIKDETICGLPAQTIFDEL